MAWIKHYASKLAYLLWLTPSGQVAHATLDRRLCRTRIFNCFSIDPHTLNFNTLEYLRKIFFTNDFKLILHPTSYILFTILYLIQTFILLVLSSNIYQSYKFLQVFQLNRFLTFSCIKSSVPQIPLSSMALFTLSGIVATLKRIYPFLSPYLFI